MAPCTTPIPLRWTRTSAEIKRALKIILPGRSYNEILETLGCARLDERRSELCQKTLLKIAKGGPLSQHLPEMRNSVHDHQTRFANKYTTFKCRTKRLRRSFFRVQSYCRFQITFHCNIPNFVPKFGNSLRSSKVHFRIPKPVCKLSI